ncbi:MAG TPA: PAS domain-containing protein, partial [Burkholderiales bacterium]|nr:PAS domain-containing protein [Burkholderiales bacterium]
MHNLESQLRLFAEQNLEFAIMFLDQARHVQWWGPGAEHIFGYDESEMLGKAIHVLFTPEDTERGVPEYEVEAANLGLSAEDDRWMMRKDGSRFYASGTLHALKGGGGESLGYCKILRD